MNYYIVNSEGYYFHVHQEVDFSRMRECAFFETKEQMYKHVMSQWDLAFDEVDCGEMIIKDNCCFDSRGVSDRIYGSIEDFIAGFVL